MVRPLLPDIKCAEGRNIQLGVINLGWNKRFFHSWNFRFARRQNSIPAASSPNGNTPSDDDSLSWGVNGITSFVVSTLQC